LQVTTDALRSWERNGLIQVPRDPQNRYRIYTSTQIGQLRVIRMLRSAGYSSMAILRMTLHLKGGGRGDLRQVLDTPRPDEDIYSAADRWLSALAEQLDRSWKIIDQLEEMIRDMG
jgi:DNA-binding transcriptional MerR regulator